MCPGAMSRGVRGARWTQIDAIARANVPCRTLERRLPCQMIFRKAWNRALTAVRAVRRSSSKSSRELMCPGAMTGGVCCARWTQIGATARADVPCRPLERRLPCQMVCGKRERMACTAVYAKLGFFLQIIARANVPWSAVWRGSRRSMDTNRCHRASRCALQAPRKAIAVPDDLQEQGTEGYYDLRERGTPVPRRPSPNNRSPHQRTARDRELVKGWSRNLLRLNKAKLIPTTAATLSTKTWVFTDKTAFRAVLSTESALFMDKIESTGVSDLVPTKS